MLLRGLRSRLPHAPVVRIRPSHANMSSSSEPHICAIVPPYLLNAISQSTQVDDHHKKTAQFSLDFHQSIIQKREQRLAALTAPRGQRRQVNFRPSIVPDYLLKNIVDNKDVDEKTRACAKRDLEHIQKVHSSYQATQGVGGSADDSKTESSARKIFSFRRKPKHKEGQTGEQTDADTFYRAVYDANHSENENALPGKQVRIEGQKAVTDVNVNEAYDNTGHVLDFYESIFNWKSIDNENMHVVSSVHFATNYENAFWDPEKMQMVFGDGGDFLYHFTKCVDVIGHEMTHAVTEHTSPLDYQGQSGALNEHISDVFGIMIKQKVENEDAANADWLIGEGCLLPDVKGVSLRSMKAPGTAYDDPRFGKDPQPDNFKDYKITVEDNGGVHLYSGIPNKAFYLASVAFGGYSWEKAGQVWWKTMNSGRIPPKCTFLQYADVTVDIAQETFGDDAAKIVRNAWNEVGVQRRH